RGIARLHMRDLRLAVVGLHPIGFRDESADLRSRRNQLAGPDLALAYGAVGWGMDFGIAKIDLRDGESGFFGVEVGDELALLRFEHGSCAALGFVGGCIGG